MKICILVYSNNTKVNSENITQYCLFSVAKIYLKLDILKSREAGILTNPPPEVVASHLGYGLYPLPIHKNMKWQLRGKDVSLWD